MYLSLNSETQSFIESQEKNGSGTFLRAKLQHL